MTRQLPNPTDGELAILQVLWSRAEPATVRQVLEQLNPARGGVGYTTVLKLLQIMTVKGLVIRNETERTHSYRPAISQDQTQRKLVKELLARAFGGSASKLVLHALDAVKAPPHELAEIQKLINQKRESKP